MRGLSCCLECGSLRLRMITASEGGVGFGTELNLAHCVDCAWQGMPISFEDEAAWRAFVAARAQDRAGAVAGTLKP